MDGWFLAKFSLVAALTWYHHLLGRWRKDLTQEQNRHPAKFYRIANEVPAALMIAIVILVIVKPF
jgi:putative membrane protein